MCVCVCVWQVLKPSGPPVSEVASPCHLETSNTAPPQGEEPPINHVSFSFQSSLPSLLPADPSCVRDTLTVSSKAGGGESEREDKSLFPLLHAFIYFYEAKTRRGKREKNKFCGAVFAPLRVRRISWISSHVLACAHPDTVRPCLNTHTVSSAFIHSDHFLRSRR